MNSNSGHMPAGDEPTNVAVQHDDRSRYRVDLYSSRASVDSYGALGQSRIPRSVPPLLVWIFLQGYAYYGLTTILVIFMKYHVDLSTEDSTTVVHLFISSTFIFSLLGGMIADLHLGNFGTIVISGVVWGAGNAALAVFAAPVQTFRYFWVVGLILVAMGKGAATPCNSALVGDQLVLPNGSTRNCRSRVFSMVYLALCTGSLITKWLSPFIRSHIVGHASTSFTVTSGAVVLGTLVVAMSRPILNKLPPSEQKSSSAFVDVVRIVWARITMSSRSAHAASTEELAPLAVADEAPPSHKPHYLDAVVPRFGYERVRQVKCLLRILKVMAPMPVFWSLYFQTFSTFTFSADDMNRNILGYTFCPDQFTTLNALFDVVLIPLFTYHVYPFAARLMRVTPLGKMTVGMLFAVASFVVAGLVQIEINKHPVDDGASSGGVHVLWQVPQYVLLSIAEVMLAITGLEFAYSQSPAPMKSAVMAFWYLTAGLGNVLVAALSQVAMSAETQYFVFAGLMLVTTVFFAWVTVGYEYEVDVLANDDAAARGSTHGGDDDDDDMSVISDDILPPHHMHHDQKPFDGLGP